MKNNVVIPQYLFDELIEYFDNKSDADGNIPNKEMQLLSQLQECSNSTGELIKEVERLKGLIKDAYDVGYGASSYAHDNSLEAYIKEPQSWEEFKTENKL